MDLSAGPNAKTAADPPLPGLDGCLFLDFDGTLTGIVDHPDDIAVEARLIDVLGTLQEVLGGAVAVISGRPIAEIDRFLAPLELAVAGKHGLEFRLPDGRVVAPEAPSAALQHLKARLQDMVADDPRLMLEDKSHTIALHYRRAPERGEDCRRMVREVLAAEGGDLQILDGKMVLEIKPGHSNKGRAVETFMAEPAFRCRRPLYAGDDVTDEDGFAVVNAMNGVSIRVGGAEETQARYRIGEVDQFLDWLSQATQHLAREKRENLGEEA